MGRRGPRPMPSTILRMRGSWRGNSNHTEPGIEPARPVCPRWLDKEAKRQWRVLVRCLEQARVITPADGNALARYCHLWSRWRKAEEFLAKYGETYPVKSEDGRVRFFMPFPQVSIANRLCQHLARLEAELGLTPSARSRIRIDPTPYSPHRRADNDFFAGGGPKPPRPVGAERR